jgi:UDP-N-acetylmuramate dehydrogenase
MRKLPAPDLPGSFIRHGVSLAPFTTWGVGGIAETLFTPQCRDDLLRAVEWARDNAGDFYVLGGGSNVLIADGLLETPVILTTGMSGITVRNSGDAVYMDCLAGTCLKNVISLSVKNGWSGLECLSGIPGTVGGAVAGNAGTATGAIGPEVENLLAVEKDGSTIEWAGREIAWSYRHCPLFGSEKRVAMSVTFKMRVADRQGVAEAAKRVMEMRKSQPFASRTAGCVFKNPPSGSAGRLLDASGCKGMSVGGARVSDSHANFIENDGNCTAGDIMALAALCRKKVQNAFGTSLDFEIKTMGFPGAHSDA